MASFKDTLQLPKTEMPIGADLPNKEPPVYAAWHSADVYSRMKRDGQNPFILHDGPPYANGDIHVGHALNKILKDFIVKFQYFNGRAVEFVPGWDCHGLPIEQKVNAQLRLGGGSLTCDSDVFNTMCRRYAAQQIANQKEQFKSLGVLADWNNHYETMNPQFEQMIADSLRKLKEKNLLVQRKKPVYWSWAYQTALAEAEIEYREKTDQSIYVAFLSHKVSHMPLGGLLVWTTTPWTLPANVAVAVNPNLEYKACTIKNCLSELLVASALVESLKEKGFIEAVRPKSYKGSELVGWLLSHPIYPEQKIPVVAADFVSATDGTGCVHIAPGHGEEDYWLGVNNNLPVVMPVGPDGSYVEGKYAGQWIFEDDSNTSLAAKKNGTFKKNSYNSNPNILADLKEKGLLVHVENYTHNYPYCSRSDTPIIFRATEQWFLDLPQIRDNAIAALKDVSFIPDNSRNRILSMLQGRSDWCISRQRSWGVPIFSGPDVLDVWFDSGLTWKTLQDRQADVYLEGNDQHRGWFQSSLWLAVALSGRAPYKNVLTHGFVVDQHGKKMEKSKGNVVSPLDIIRKHGAEVLRYWVASTDYTGEVQCGPEIIKQASDGYRKLRNTFRYLVANMPSEKPDEKLEMAFAPDGWIHFAPVDSWIHKKTREVFEEVHKSFENHQFYSGLHILTNYINNDLSGIYMNAVKDRLYCGRIDSYSRTSAVLVMADILRSFMGLMAPLFTYTTQEVFSYCPRWVFGDAKDVFDICYRPLPKLEYDFDEKYWKECLQAFHAEFDKAKNSKLVRDTLEVVLETDHHQFFAGAADWFVVSDVSHSKSEPLGEFTVFGDTYRIVKSSKNKCERCWKRNADKDLCPRCLPLVKLAEVSVSKTPVLS